MGDSSYGLCEVTRKIPPIREIPFGTWVYILMSPGKTFWYVKTIRTQIWRIHLDVLSVHNKFHEKTIFFVTYIKKIKKKSCENPFVSIKICLFYTRHKECRFFHETCHAHIERQDVCAKFVFELF